LERRGDSSGVGSITAIKWDLLLILRDTVSALPFVFLKLTTPTPNRSLILYTSWTSLIPNSIPPSYNKYLPFFETEIQPSPSIKPTK